MASLNHIEPDKVPIDLGANNTGIHIIAYKNLLEYLDIEDKDIHYRGFKSQSAIPCEEVLQRFDIDIRWLRPTPDSLPENHKPEVHGKLQGTWDTFGVFWGDSADKNVEDILYYSPCIHPLSEMTTVQQIKEFDWPDGSEKKRFVGLREQAKKLRESTPYAIGARPIGILWDYVTWRFGFSKAMRHLRKSPEMITAVMEGLEKFWLEYATAFLNEVKFGDEYYVDVAELMGDLGAQSGPIMNPEETYAPIIKPIELRFARKLKELALIKLNYHCCGSIPRFIPHFAEIGYDAVNPVQIGAFDMEPCSLKQRFGKDITFWGGLCDTQNTLPFGTPKQIREEVKRNLDCFKPGGGYIAANVHNILAEVPPENIVAMFDTAREFRNY
ncbi:MAG: uroporphyrinogen decarboxylase family protein [Candidatus Thorarchaeota archaeon]